MKEFDRSAAAKKGWEKSRDKYYAYYDRVRTENLLSLPEVECPKCKTNLSPEQVRQGNKYCSHACAALTNNKGGRPKRLPRDCPGCSTGFVTTFSGQIYCSGKCKTDHVNNSYIARWLNGEESGLSGDAVSRHIRKWLLAKCDGKCTRCGWNEVNPTTGSSPLNVEHIDGDYRNNHPDNLTILCPNCHSLTSTYGSLNIGKGRPGRYKKH